MNLEIFQQIACAITEVEATSSTLEKTRLLRDLLNRDQYPDSVHQVFRVAFDPAVSTFLTKVPTPTAHFPNQVFNPFDPIREILGGGRLTKAQWGELASLAQAWLDEKSRRIFWKVMTKDLAIGASLATYNKALASSSAASTIPPIFEFDTVRVSNIEDAQINPLGSFVSMKIDGVNATYTSRGFISRNGNLIPLPHLEAALSPLENQFVLMGELASSTRQISSGLVNSAIKRGFDADPRVATLQFHVFDVLTQEEYARVIDAAYRKLPTPTDLTPFHKRLCLSQEIQHTYFANAEERHLGVSFLSHVPVNSIEEVYSLYEQAVSSGEEGIIWNDSNMTFSLERSKKRARIKEILTGDFVITGFNEHSRIPGTLGSFRFSTRCGALFSDTGSGLSEAQRKLFWDNREALLDKTIQVSYNRVIPNSRKEGSFSLFLPVLDTDNIIRYDKPTADTLEELSWGSKDAEKRKWLLRTSK